MNSQAPTPGTISETRRGISEAPPASGGGSANLLRLLQLEADIRRVRTERELIYHAANECREVLGFRQAFVFRLRGRWRIEAASSVASFDPQSPLTRDIERLLAAKRKTHETDSLHNIDLSILEGSEFLNAYAFPYGLWVPLFTRNGRCFAGMLLLRDTPWPEPIKPLVERVAAVYAHAWEALSGKRLTRSLRLTPKLGLVLLAAVVAASCFIYAPVTALVPAEVTSREKSTIAATINGVIDDVLVEPNSYVEKGTVLARYEDTEIRNALKIADREAIVARAELEKQQNASFTDPAASRELRVAEAQLALALAEVALAKDRMERVDILAPRSGLAVFEDRRDLIGIPVSVGQHLMEIVEPEDLEFTVRLPVGESIVLQPGARLRVFLDSNPLEPVEATLTRRTYGAAMLPDGIFGYTLTASPEDGQLDASRLGSQGTAQLYGGEYPLLFIVFRRPLSWFRQTFGF